VFGNYVTYGTHKDIIYLKTGHEGPERNRGIAVLFFLVISALEEGGWLTPSLGRFTSGKNPVPIV